MDDCFFFALSLITDDGKKLVPIGQYFRAQDKFVLFEATKNSLWKGKKKMFLFNRALFGQYRAHLSQLSGGLKQKSDKSCNCFAVALRMR